MAGMVGCGLSAEEISQRWMKSNGAMNQFLRIALTLVQTTPVAEVKKILASWRDVVGGRRDLPQSADFQLSWSATGPKVRLSEA
jgi:phosphoserine phosphatase